MKTKRTRVLISVISFAVIIGMYLTIMPSHAQDLSTSSQIDAMSKEGLRTLSPDAALLKYVVQKLSDLTRL